MKSFLLLFFAFTLIAVVHADETGNFDFNEFEENLQKEEDFSTQEVPPNTQVDAPGGPVTVSGSTSQENGRLSSENIETSQSATTNVVNFDLQGASETFTSADTYETDITTSAGAGTLAIADAQDVSRTDDSVTVGSAQTIDTETSAGNINAQDVLNFRQEGDVIEVESASVFETSGGNNPVQIINGQNIRIDGDTTTFDFADTFTQNGAVSTTVQNVVSNPATFSVIAAESIIIEDVTFTEVDDTEFTIFSNAVQAVPQNDLQAMHSSGVQVTYEPENTLQEFAGSKNAENAIQQDGTTNPNIPTEDDVQLVAFQDSPATYQISNGKLTVGKRFITAQALPNGTIQTVLEPGQDPNAFSERIETTETAKIVVDPLFGVHRVTMTGPSTYWYDHDFFSDFGIHAPVQENPYELCIRRSDTQTCNNTDAFIDLFTNRKELRKQVYYLRYPFEGDQLYSLLMDSAYEGYNESSQTVLDFANRNAQPATVVLSQLDVVEQDVSYAANGFFEFTETDATQTLNLKRPAFHPKLMGQYTAEFSPLASFFTDRHFDQAKITAYSAGDPQLEEIEQLLPNYWQSTQTLP